MSVAFIGDGGTLKFTRSDGMGCLIPPTVKQIQGFNSATIEVTKFVYEQNTSKAALWYKSMKTSGYIRDIDVSCTGVPYGRGFLNCANLLNCRGYASGLESSYGDGVAFEYCTGLKDCTGGWLWRKICIWI